MLAKDYSENRKTLLFCVFVASLTLGLIVWGFLPSPGYWQLEQQTPQTVGRYFYEMQRGSTQNQVEYWLGRNGLKVECADNVRPSEAIYVRVNTRPQSLLRIEFSHHRFSDSSGYIYEGACPPHFYSVS